MNKLKTIYFYNHFHGGDLFVSKEFVRWMVHNIPAEKYVYCHHNSPKLIADIPELIIQNKIPKPQASHWSLENGCLYANTWYGACDFKYFAHKASLQTLYSLFSGELKRVLNIDLPDPILSFIPEIDYKFFKIENAKRFMETVKASKKIFISNGKTLSGQSTNFNFNPIVEILAKKYPDILFFLSNDEHQITRDNVLYTKDIIDIKENDLNENSYITNFCEILVGRNSGTYTYAFTKENMKEDHVFISFIRDKSYFSFGLKQYYPGKFVYGGNFTQEAIVDTISKYMRR